jgi:RNA polymerase subunit RPABC4/transcription elongation factor Spt4
VVVDEPKRVEDIPCPKCGSDDVRISWQDRDTIFASAHDRCKHEVESSYVGVYSVEMYFEHFHRTCQRCHYWWPTADILDAT